MFIRDAYLVYWAAFQTYKRSFTTEEIVPAYPALAMIGEEGSAERKFRLAVGLYLAREGKIPSHLVDSQRDNHGHGQSPKKRGRPKKGRPFGFNNKLFNEASGSVSGSATPMEPTSAESNASGDESSRLGSLAPRESSQVSDMTSNYNSPLPYYPPPPPFHHQPHSFGSTIDHLALSSRPTSVEPSTRPNTSSSLQHAYNATAHTAYPLPLPENVYYPDPPSAQV